MTKKTQKLFKRRAEYKIWLVPYFRSETGILVEFRNKNETLKIDHKGPPLRFQTNRKREYTHVELKKITYDLIDALKERVRIVYPNDTKVVTHS